MDNLSHLKESPYNYSFILEMEVRDYELDSEKIVNNANYLHYMEHTRHKFCREAGVSFIEMVERDIVTVVRSINIEYFKSLRSGDKFYSCLKLEREGARFIFHQEILNERFEKVSIAKITVVALIGGKLSRGDELAQMFHKYLQE